MTYEEIFEKTKEIVLSHNTEGLNNNIAVQINIVGEGEGIFYIALKDGVVFIEPYTYNDNDCIFIITGKDLIKICEGKLSPIKAFTIGKLKIKGSIEKALEFSKIIEEIKEK